MAPTERLPYRSDRCWLLLMLLASGLVARWLWQQPDLLGSDDALNFSRAIDHFSVLEFSPHFPGYPAFVMLARITTFLGGADDPASTTLLNLTRAAALLLPWLSWGLLRSNGSPPWIAASGFLLVLGTPLLSGLGLAGLSDGPALCWLAATFWSLSTRRYRRAGLLLGLCLATRPSLAPLLILPLLQVLMLQPRSRRRLIPGVAAIGLLCLAFLLSRDGVGWFSEGMRFIDGHFRLWGNSALSHDRDSGWYQATARLMGTGWLLPAVTLLVLGLQWPLRTGPGAATRLLLSLFLIDALLWTLVAQNPENLRHLAPLLWGLICLGGLTLTELLRSRPGGAVLLPPLSPPALLLRLLPWLSAVPLLVLLITPPAPPPVQQAALYLQRHGHQTSQLLASNYGVELLRSQLNEFSVSDSFYPGSAARVLQQGGWRLSARPPATTSGQPAEQYRFDARSPAEKPLWLYRLKTQKQSTDGGCRSGLSAGDRDPPDWQTCRFR